ncbi:MAG: AhpC/TSA family protein [Flavobacteriaceae bacterium]|nr:AhpC/TSA family protein [Flavobacteriaceae bacterium]
MSKKLLWLLIVVPFILQGQHSIKGSIKPDNNYTWILLYQLENGRQTFVDNANVVNGKFQFNIDENKTSGIYRAYFHIENNLYIEFIYNKENIDLTFDPNNPIESIQFISSSENKIYQAFHKNITSKQKQLDSLQVAYFKSKDKKHDQFIANSYQESLKALQAVQLDYEKISEGKLAHHFIKASKQYYAPTPFKAPKDYMASVKLHFFDAIDFNDQVLSDATFVNDRLTDYVFYLNQADNMTTKNMLQKKAIDDISGKLNNNFELHKNFEESLINQYLVDENTEMTTYVLNKYYKFLPDAYQDAALEYKITSAMKTALGTEAADFSWTDNGVQKNLHSLIGFDYYIVVFFSATCSHCEIEMPDFYEFIKDIENVRVIAVGLEDTNENWKKMITNFDGFTNILDLKKWDSPKVKDYGISAIPSYFVLDANKRILAKPNDVTELKTMFETR